jgi:hypothetical protein
MAFYSITSSARASSEGGTLRLSAFADDRRLSPIQSIFLSDPAKHGSRDGDMLRTRVWQRKSGA